MPPTWTSGEANSDSESVDSRNLCPLGQGFFLCCKKAGPLPALPFMRMEENKTVLRRCAHLCRRCEPAAEQPPGFPLGREIPIRAEIGRESPEPPAARTRDSCAVCGVTASGVPPERKVCFPALADGHSLSASLVGMGAVRPTAGNRRFFGNPGDVRNTVPGSVLERWITYV